MKRATKKKGTWFTRLKRRVKKIAKDHFIPHPGNKHVPHVLHHRALFGYSVVLILLKVLVVTVGLSFPGYSLFSSAITPNNIIGLTNETRRNLNLPELATDPKLMQAAQAKAEDMFLNGYFAHTSPEGTTPWYWFRSFGYNYRSAGENLAAHFTQAEDVEAGWMASPTHRDNIVSDRYNEIGVGVAQGVFEDYQTTFVVQMFGYELEQDPQVAAEVETPSPSPSPAGEGREAEEVVPVTEEPTTVAIATADTLPPSTPEPVAEPGSLFVDTSSLVLSPIEGGYAVTLGIQNASQAVLYLGGDRFPVIPSESDPNLWQSVVLYNPATISANGERLYIVVGNWDGEQQIVDLTWIMPGSSAPEVYAFQGADAPKLLGVMDVANVDDAVHNIYLITLVLLGAALMIAVFVKIEVQKPTMIAHSLAVLALALLLSAV
jgi:hypothetical protein